MPTDSFITASSGFILPINSYYKPYKIEDTITDAIFNKHIASINNESVKKFYEDKNVYRSEIINKVLNDYINNKSFENYIAIINIAIEIFKEMDFSSFFKLQATNTNLSFLSYRFCLDVVSGKFKNNYLEYAIVPFNLRFTLNNGLTHDKAMNNIREIEKLQCKYVTNWETFLSELAEDKDAFLIFFKYIFADYY